MSIDRKQLCMGAVIAIFAAALAVTQVAAQVPNTYVTRATGDQEVPPVDTEAVSVGQFHFVKGDSLFVGFRLNLRHDQTVTDVHIHEAPPGVDGPIVLNMRPTGPGEGICIDLAGGLITYYALTSAALRGSLEGQTLTDLKNLMATGNTYINLHTPENPGGWIRGQMIPRP
jgi:hypothetical protein